MGAAKEAKVCAGAGMMAPQLMRISLGTPHRHQGAAALGSRARARRHRETSSNAVYPKPDRSDYRPTRTRSAEEPSIDIGWGEGFLRDGRPYRVECWAEEGVTMLTYFFSTRGSRPTSTSNSRACWKPRAWSDSLTSAAGSLQCL